MNDFNPTENKELAQLAADARKARARAAQRAQTYVNGGTPTKEIVDPTEYLQRLNRSMKRDTVIVKEVQQARITHSLADWKEKVGPTFAEATTDNPKVKDRVARLQTRQGRHKTSLLMQGNVGTGKSWLGYAYINLAISSGAVTAGQVVADTESGILSRIASSGFKRAELLEELFSPRNQIFFIDDVGTGYFSNLQGQHQVWYELIDHIYAHQLTLIMTTNLSLQDGDVRGPTYLKNWVGSRAFDRIKTLVGDDGIMEPGKVNRRGSVLEERERRFRAGDGA